MVEVLETKTDLLFENGSRQANANYAQIKQAIADLATQLVNAPLLNRALEQGYEKALVNLEHTNNDIGAIFATAFKSEFTTYQQNAFIFNDILNVLQPTHIEGLLANNSNYLTQLATFFMQQYMTKLQGNIDPPTSPFVSLVQMFKQEVSPSNIKLITDNLASFIGSEHFQQMFQLVFVAIKQFAQDPNSTLARVLWHAPLDSFAATPGEIKNNTLARLIKLVMATLQDMIVANSITYNGHQLDFLDTLYVNFDAFLRLPSISSWLDQLLNKISIGTVTRIPLSSIFDANYRGELLNLFFNSTNGREILRVLPRTLVDAYHFDVIDNNQEFKFSRILKAIALELSGQGSSQHAVALQGYIKGWFDELLKLRSTQQKIAQVVIAFFPTAYQANIDQSELKNALAWIVNWFTKDTRFYNLVEAFVSSFGEYANTLGPDEEFEFSGLANYFMTNKFTFEGGELTFVEILDGLFREYISNPPRVNVFNILLQILKNTIDNSSGPDKQNSLSDLIVNALVAAQLQRQQANNQPVTSEQRERLRLEISAKLKYLLANETIFAFIEQLFKKIIANYKTLAIQRQEHQPVLKTYGDLVLLIKDTIFQDDEMWAKFIEVGKVLLREDNFTTFLPLDFKPLLANFLGTNGVLSYTDLYNFATVFLATPQIREYLNYLLELFFFAHPNGYQPLSLAARNGNAINFNFDLATALRNQTDRQNFIAKTKELIFSATKNPLLRAMLNNKIYDALNYSLITSQTLNLDQNTIATYQQTIRDFSNIVLDHLESFDNSVPIFDHALELYIQTVSLEGKTNADFVTAFVQEFMFNKNKNNLFDEFVLGLTHFWATNAETSDNFGRILTNLFKLLLHTMAQRQENSLGTMLVNALPPILKQVIAENFSGQEINQFINDLIRYRPHFIDSLLQIIVVDFGQYTINTDSERKKWWTLQKAFITIFQGGIKPENTNKIDWTTTIAAGNYKNSKLYKFFSNDFPQLLDWHTEFFKKLFYAVLVGFPHYYGIPVTAQLKKLAAESSDDLFFFPTLNSAAPHQLFLIFKDQFFEMLANGTVSAFNKTQTETRAQAAEPTAFPVGVDQIYRWFKLFPLRDRGLLSRSFANYGKLVLSQLQKRPADVRRLITDFKIVEALLPGLSKLVADNQANISFSAAEIENLLVSIFTDSQMNETLQTFWEIINTKSLTTGDYEYVPNVAANITFENLINVMISNFFGHLGSENTIKVFTAIINNQAIRTLAAKVLVAKLSTKGFSDINKISSAVDTIQAFLWHFYQGLLADKRASGTASVLSSFASSAIEILKKRFLRADVLIRNQSGVVIENLTAALIDILLSKISNVKVKKDIKNYEIDLKTLDNATSFFERIFEKIPGRVFTRMLNLLFEASPANQNQGIFSILFTPPTAETNKTLSKFNITFDPTSIKSVVSILGGAIGRIIFSLFKNIFTEYVYDIQRNKEQWVWYRNIHNNSEPFKAIKRLAAIFYWNATASESYTSGLWFKILFKVLHDGFETALEKATRAVPAYVRYSVKYFAERTSIYKNREIGYYQFGYWSLGRGAEPDVADHWWFGAANGYYGIAPNENSSNKTNYGKDFISSYVIYGKFDSTRTNIDYHTGKKMLDAFWVYLKEMKI
ncbi:hypothetical protein [Mycoplasmopsis columbinasalis]|uniref:Uncharacterized protein n=1 Tax=Mycoplasmopsis columbinasalis TaxID=114880 RepID=A0A449B9F8_9BACT|nr:hypothetical protein [Mycoplasmopsis columbinasalis]VEU77793.1 Uncharacterised protein [Mycoplasmopsis columbinasalis]